MTNCVIKMKKERNKRCFKNNYHSLKPILKTSLMSQSDLLNSSRGSEKLSEKSNEQIKQQSNYYSNKKVKFKIDNHVLSS